MKIDEIRKLLYLLTSLCKLQSAKTISLISYNAYIVVGRQQREARKPRLALSSLDYIADAIMIIKWKEAKRNVSSLNKYSSNKIYSAFCLPLLVCVM